MLQAIARNLTTIVCAIGLMTALTLPVAAQEFRVEGAGLEAVPLSYRGPCPGLIKLVGKIQASAGGRVKYTYFYGDGATGPEGFVDFEGLGVKHVETTWTLGGASLTHYEGWGAIRLLSNRARFVIDCQLSKEKLDAQPAVGPQDKGAETYQNELPNLSAPSRQKFEKEMASLDSLARKLRPALAKAQNKLGFDSKAMNAQFRAITEEPDAGMRAQRSAEFQTKYEPQLIKLAQTAGIDLAAQRRQMIALLDLSKAQVKESKVLGIIEIGDERPPTPAPTPPPPPDVTERILSAPFTSAGRLGDRSLSNAANGDMSIRLQVNLVGAASSLAFISQTLAVEPGVQRVRVFGAFDPLTFVTGAASSSGYASSEAAVNLRVMEGSRIIASDRISLWRVVSILGISYQSGARPVTLECDFTRLEPDEATTYTLIAEIEGLAGALIFASAGVEEQARLRQFQVYLHRR